MTRTGIALTCVAIFSLASAAAAQYADRVVTDENALLCTSPFRIKEAYSASVANDEKWLRSLNCVRARGGIPATVIERNSLGWQVRLEGVTMWGDRLQFRAPTGEYMDDFGKLIRR